MGFTLELADEARTIANPLVLARVDAENAHFILDTGASDPVLVRWFADAVDIESEPDEPGTDHAGASVETSVATHPVTLELEHEGYTIDSALIIEGPPFESMRIGGFLAPQLTAPGGRVELDLRAGVLRRWSETGEAVAIEIQRRIGAAPLELARVPGQGDGQRLLIVQAELRGHGAIRLLINTGARQSEISPALVAQTGATVQNGRGVSGEAVSGTRGREPVTLELDGTTMRLEDYLVRDQGPHFDAQIGMDQLADAVLLMEASDRSTVFFWPAAS